MMNKERRKTLTRLAQEVQNLHAQLEDIKSELEGVRDEEQEYYDNMPESFQGGDKGEAAQTAINAMDEALDGFPDLDEVAGLIQAAGE